MPTVAPSTQHDSVGPPEGVAAPPMSRAQVLEAIDAQTCPFCGAGPFKVVAIHIAQTHGVRIRSVRSHYGISQTHTTAAPETAARFSALQRKRMADPTYQANLLEWLRKAQPTRYRTGYKKPPEQIDKERGGTDTTCATCGRVFHAPPVSRRRFCSHACYAATVGERWKDPVFRERIGAASRAAKKAARKMRTCTICGRPFWNGQRTTCSAGCLHEAKIKSGRRLYASRQAREKTSA